MSNCLFQVLALTPGEERLLRDHMAHSYKVHDMFYRQQEVALSLAKMSRVLVAIESGKATAWQGVNYKDIDVESKCKT